MKTFLHITMRCAALLVLAGVIAVPMFAQTSNSPVNRVTYQGETHTGRCCSEWEASVTIHEPEKIVPIVVTFSADYQATAPFLVALRLNDAPCAFYGPAFLPTFLPDSDGILYSSRTFQWVVMPGDYKLVRGKNVLTVCGGGLFSASDSVTLGFNTLTAHLQK